MEEITIIKQNPNGEEVWRYSGTVLARGDKHLVLQAYFDREDMDFHGMRLCKGDRFVETYYFERWYNIFEIYDRLDDKLKGWYCNVCSPAVEIDGCIAYRDLALDLLVFPNKDQIVLDEDEFEALTISQREREHALAALAELQEFFSAKKNG